MNHFHGILLFEISNEPVIIHINIPFDVFQTIISFPNDNDDSVIPSTVVV